MLQKAPEAEHPVGAAPMLTFSPRAGQARAEPLPAGDDRLDAGGNSSPQTGTPVRAHVRPPTYGAARIPFVDSVRL